MNWGIKTYSVHSAVSHNVSFLLNSVLLPLCCFHPSTFNQLCLERNCIFCHPFAVYVVCHGAHDATAFLFSFLSYCCRDRAEDVVQHATGILQCYWTTLVQSSQPLLCYNFALNEIFILSTFEICGRTGYVKFRLSQFWDKLIPNATEQSRYESTNLLIYNVVFQRNNKKKWMADVLSLTSFGGAWNGFSETSWLGFSTILQREQHPCLNAILPNLVRTSLTLF